MNQFDPINYYEVNTGYGKMIVETFPKLLEERKNNHTIISYEPLKVYKIENAIELINIIELREQFFDYIDFIDPYADPDELDKDQTLSDMLYNLIEIKKDWKFKEGTEELTRLNDLIDSFLNMGITPSNIGG